MQPTPAEFLRQLLADDGYKVAVVFSGGKVKHQTFFKDVDTLAAALASEDHRGLTVYHACATYREPTTRTQDNVALLKALWLDVDAGEGKPYPNAEEAYRAVLAFCVAAQLPTPTFVSSGRGLHVYWFLQTAIAQEEWLPYAQGLKVLAANHGLHSDPARTADAASILRPPGSTHRKDTPRPVLAGVLEGPYPLDAFRACLDVAPAEGLAPRRTPRTAPRLIAAALNIHSPAAVSVDAVVAGCSQLRGIAAVRGNVVEPLWYAALNIAARCIGGAQLIHDFSDGHPTYSAQETEAKAARALQLSGPTTCAHFQSLNPAGCQGCPYTGKITTPFQLGTLAPEEIVTPQVPELPPVQEGEEPVQFPSLPPDFRYGSHGELLLMTERDGKDVTLLVSKHPLFLHAVQVAEVRAQFYSLHFKHFKPLEGWEDIDLPANKMLGPNAAAEMAQRGIVIHNTNAFQKYVREAVDQYQASRRSVMKYEQMGWKEDESAFLVGRTLYTAQGPKTVAVSDDLVARAIRYGLGPSRHGSLDAWKEAAERLFGEGREVLAFALMAGFAAPLMKFHRAEEGGCIISIISQESGRGKSTSIDGVGSIWGAQRKALEITTTDTTTSQGLTLAAVGNMVCVFDEIRERDPGDTKQFVYVYTQGHDKQRATRDGELRQVAGGWQNLMITTANRSLVDLLTQDGDGVDAPVYRILEFSVTERIVIENHDRIKNVMRDNSGHAGDRFMRYLVRPEVVEWLRNAVPDEAVRISKLLGFKPEHRFWARALACVSIASQIVKHLGILSFTPERIMEWAYRSIRTDLQMAAEVAAVAGPPAVSYLADFLNEHTGNMIVMSRAFRPGTPVEMPLRMPGSRLCIRYELDTRRLVISTRAFRSWMGKKQINMKPLIAELMEKNVVTRQAVMTLPAGSPVPGAQEPVLVLDGNHKAVSGFLDNVATLEPPAPPAG